MKVFIAHMQGFLYWMMFFIKQSPVFSHQLLNRIRSVGKTARSLVINEQILRDHQFCTHLAGSMAEIVILKKAETKLLVQAIELLVKRTPADNTEEKQQICLIMESS